MKKEVEILFELKESLESVTSKITDLTFVGKKETKDVYYVDPLREELKPDEDSRLKNSFRLRDKEGAYSLAYKVDHFNGDVWSYSDEYEIQVSDYKTTEQIIKQLGLEELVTVETHKTIFKDTTFEVVLEEVKNLGLFIEIEFHEMLDDADINNAKEKIREWIKKHHIDVGEELNAGKPELMLTKNLTATS